MPQVDRFSFPQVQEAPLPDVRQTALPSAAALGGGEPAAANFNAVDDAFQKIKQNADQVAILDAQNKLAEFENKRLYDPQEGALSKQGKDTLGIADEVSADYAKYASEIQNGLSGRQQQEAFARISQDRFNDVNKILQRHTASEMDKYDDEQSMKGLDLAYQGAVRNFGDEQLVIKGINEQNKILFDYGKRKGKSQEWYDAESAKQTSMTQRNVIEKIVDSESAMADLAAKSYYDRHKDTLNSEDRDAVEKLLKTKTLLATATRNADIIFKNNKYSQQSAMEKVREIEDPTIREKTRDVVKQYFSDQEGAQRSDQENLYLQLYNLQDNGKPLPVTLLHQLTPSQQRALKESHRAREDDPKFVYDLRAMASNPQTRDAFKKMNLADPINYSRMSDQTFKELSNLQNKPNSDDKFKGIESIEQTIKNNYEAAGFNVPGGLHRGDETYKQWEDYRQAINKEILRTKDDSPENIDKITKGLLKKTILNRGWIFNTTTPNFKAGEIDPNSIDLKVIDPNVLDKLKSSLRQGGKDPDNEENVKRLYLEALKAGRI